MSVIRPTRLRLFVATLVWYALAGTVGAQDVATDEAYHVRALHGGGSRLRDIAGEKVLEFPIGVRVVHGDVTITSDRGLHYANVRVTRLIGNVKIIQQTMTMWGDEGDYTGFSDEAVLRDNVRIVDEGWEVTCDRATYSRISGNAWLTGNVVARDSTSTLRADSLFYNRNTERSEAFGNVEITNPDEGFVVRGQHGIYFRSVGEGLVDRDPRLTVDPDAAEPVTIVSDTMRVFPDSSHALAYYRVKIIKGNTVTQCDSAVLFDNRNRAELYGSPLARQDNVSMAGNAMVLHYDDDEVHKIDILGGAEIREAQRDSLVVGRDSWMQGDTVAMYLHENTVDSILVTRNASSEYFPQARPFGGKVESNFIRGDEMFFRFQEDSLAYVRVNGSASGVYRYADLGKSETIDSLRALGDTTLTYSPFRDNNEKVVYSAKNLEYFADTGDLVLDESARVRYQDSELSGDDVTYYSSQQLLDATGSPELTENNDKFFGTRMNYDMESKAGLVVDGSTQFQEGYYNGEHVAKVGDDEMKVWGSNYTTCDLKTPHFHFAAREMKVYPQDKVVTGPIWLYIGETPIAYLPFMAANLRRGRRSGILRPEFEFGFDRAGGRYIRNWGYYWATNDYTDFTFQGDFNEDSTFRIFTENRYALRYRFNGNVNYNFLRNLRTFRNEWSVSGRHKHTLGEGFSFNADFNFVSSDDAPSSINRIDNVDRVTERIIRSNASLSKRWETMNFTASASRTQYLNITDPDAVRVKTTAPDVRLSIPSRTLFFGEASRQGKAGFLETFLSNTRLSPSLSGRRTTEEKAFELREDIKIDQGLSLQSKLNLGFVTVSPQARFSNTTTRLDREILSHSEPGIDNSVDPPDTSTIFTPYEHTLETDNSFSWSTGANASANIYGTFYPSVGKLRGVRHKVSPTVGWTYVPSVGNRGPSSQRFSVSLNQTLDLKILKGKRDDEKGAKSVDGKRGSGGDRGDRVRPPDGDSSLDDTDVAPEEELTKLDGVVIWGLSSSYNPDPGLGQREWSNVSSRVNTRLLGTSVSLSQTFDPYDSKVTYTSVSSGLTFRGTHPFGRAETIAVRELNVVAASDTSEKGSDDGLGASYEQVGDVLEDRGELELEEGRLPWLLSMDVSYTRTENQEARSTLRLNSQFDLTKTWAFTYRTDYDVEARELRGQSYTVKRDLHCWEMSFSRQRLGDEWQFYFRINLKAHSEIYAEQGQRGLGGGTFGTSSLGF